MYPFLLNVFLQILDGAFTLIGVYTLGFDTDIEGNPLIKYLMDSYTPIIGIIIAKLMAFTILLFLWKCHIKYGRAEKAILHKALFVLNCIYFIVVLQWVLVLLFW